MVAAAAAAVAESSLTDCAIAESGELGRHHSNSSVLGSLTLSHKITCEYSDRQENPP